MQKLLAIDSCMREASRTRKIYGAVMDILSKKYDTSVIDVNALALEKDIKEFRKKSLEAAAKQA